MRPEKVAIFPANGDESLQGKVEESVYIGTDTRYIVRLTERSCIIVRSQHLHYSDLHKFNSSDTVKVKLYRQTASVSLQKTHLPTNYTTAKMSSK